MRDSCSPLTDTKSFHPYLVQTLEKWSAKVQAVAPAMLLPSNRNAFSKGNQHLRSAVQLVDESMTDTQKLVSRTQTWRGTGTALAKDPVGDDVNQEIFDDTDFYQQLLRDWMIAQKNKKAKKVVDTRASKGRKLR